MKKIILIAVMLALLLHGRTTAREIGYDKPGLDEKTGGFVPLDLTFTDENAQQVTLKEIIDRPTCLVILYYECSHICPQLLGGLAKSLASLQLIPGKDYRVITLSFDDSEKPEMARTQKINYIKAINHPFPEDAWRFLTGDRANIRRLTDAVGIRYQKAEHGFIHPEVLIFISPRGMITRYLHVPKFNYGVADPMLFSALELKSAFTDAAVGKISTGGSVTPLYCFLHEPANQERFFNILKVSGTLTVLAFVFLFFLLKRQRRPAG